MAAILVRGRLCKWVSRARDGSFSDGHILHGMHVWCSWIAFCHFWCLQNVSQPEFLICLPSIVCESSYMSQKCYLFSKNDTDTPLSKENTYQITLFSAYIYTKLCVKETLNGLYAMHSFSKNKIQNLCFSFDVAQTETLHFVYISAPSINC